MVSSLRQDSSAVILASCAEHSHLLLPSRCYCTSLQRGGSCGILFLLEALYLTGAYPLWDWLQANCRQFSLHLCNDSGSEMLNSQKSLFHDFWGSLPNPAILWSQLLYFTNFPVPNFLRCSGRCDVWGFDSHLPPNCWHAELKVFCLNLPARHATLWLRLFFFSTANWNFPAAGFWVKILWNTGFHSAPPTQCLTCVWCSVPLTKTRLVVTSFWGWVKLQHQLWAKCSLW